jgi:hypothetical protein
MGNPLAPADLKSSDGAPLLGTMRNSAKAVTPEGTETTALKVMSSTPMYPYGADNPHPSLGFPLSGAGDVPKFVGVGSVVCALAANGTRHTPKATPVPTKNLREVRVLNLIISGLQGKSSFAA